MPPTATSPLGVSIRRSTGSQWGSRSTKPIPTITPTPAAASAAVLSFEEIQKQQEREERKQAQAQRRAANEAQARQAEQERAAAARGIVAPSAWGGVRNMGPTKSLAEIQAEQEAAERKAAEARRAFAGPAASSQGARVVSGAASRGVGATAWAGLANQIRKPVSFLESMKRDAAEAQAQQQQQQQRASATARGAASIRTAARALGAQKPSTASPAAPQRIAATGSPQRANAAKPAAMFWDYDEAAGAAAAGAAPGTPSKSRPVASSTSQQDWKGKLPVKSLGGGGGNVFGGPGMSREFKTWCKSQLQKLSGSDDTTLVEYLMTLSNEDEIREHMSLYLGNSAKVKQFADGFLEHKRFLKDNRKSKKKASPGGQSAKPGSGIATTGGAFGALSSGGSSGANAGGLSSAARRRRRRRGKKN